MKYIFSALLLFGFFLSRAQEMQVVAERSNFEKIEDTLYIATGSEMSYVVQVLAQIFTLDYPTPYKVEVGFSLSDDQLFYNSKPELES